MAGVLGWKFAHNSHFGLHVTTTLQNGCFKLSLSLVANTNSTATIQFEQIIITKGRTTPKCKPMACNLKTAENIPLQKGPQPLRWWKCQNFTTWFTFNYYNHQKAHLVRLNFHKCRFNSESSPDNGIRRSRWGAAPKWVGQRRAPKATIVYIFCVGKRLFWVIVKNYNFFSSWESWGSQRADCLLSDCRGMLDYWGKMTWDKVGALLFGKGLV